tara:strand:- start:865 stop:1548 length:684 start_codon:yes stop_codon:yes gene_type:complete
MDKQFIIAISFLLGWAGHAQVEEQPMDSTAEKMIIIEGDSIIENAIALKEVYVFGALKFSDYDSKLKYYILRRKTLKVYPYAKMAAERLVALNDSITKIKKQRHRRRYTKEVQRFIEDEFSAELKKLTRTEGQILVKLIHRQTGSTAFALVKELRSGWRAFWYNATAKMFDITLKEEFHPESVHEDYQIEDILQRAFAADRLQPQESVLNFDYATLTDKWSKKAIKK